MCRVCACKASRMKMDGRDSGSPQRPACATMEFLHVAIPGIAQVLQIIKNKKTCCFDVFASQPTWWRDAGRHAVNRMAYSTGDLRFWPAPPLQATRRVSAHLAVRLPRGRPHLRLGLLRKQYSGRILDQRALFFNNCYRKLPFANVFWYINPNLICYNKYTHFPYAFFTTTSAMIIQFAHFHDF